MLKVIEAIQFQELTPEEYANVREWLNQALVNYSYDQDNSTWVQLSWPTPEQILECESAIRGEWVAPEPEPIIPQPEGR